MIRAFRVYLSIAGCLILLAALWPMPAFSEPLRIAVYNTELARKGPGLLLRDILRGDAQADAVASVIARKRPDILLLLNVDYDYGLAALGALRDLVADQGLHYPHMFALRPNTGVASGLDLDGDGRKGRAGDAQGYGEFSGQGGMALLSRYPVDAAGVVNFSGFLWADLPGALLPEVDGAPFPSAEAQRAQRLSSTGHWVVPVAVSADRVLNLLAFHATPPVFDGTEDRNGRRNHDEMRFWSLYLDGQFGAPPPTDFILIGDANLDVAASEGITEALEALLNDPRLQDPMPQRPHDGALYTADWSDRDVGQRRVEYVLPSADMQVLDAGVFWPSPDHPDRAMAEAASRHGLVWVDLAR